MAEDLYKLYSDGKNGPAKVVKRCKDDWKAYFDKNYATTIKENVQLYNNYSEDLAKRRADTRIKRSCLFIPVINPAVLSRVGYVTSLTFSVKDPIVTVPDPNDENSRKNSQNVTDVRNFQLKKDKFKLTYLATQLAKELYPICFWRISETEDEEMVLSIEQEQKEVLPQIKSDMPKKKNWKPKKKQRRPKVTLRTQEQVFYDTLATQWNQCRFVGEITLLSLGEIVARKDSMGYEFDLQYLKDNGTKVSVNAFQEEVRSASGDSSRETTGIEQKYEVCEAYIKIEDQDGKVDKRFITSCGDVKLKDVPFPYDKLDIPDIFIPQIGYPILNQVEGITTADLLKHIQHATNDGFNILYDFMKYGLFGPRERDSRFKVLSEKKIGLGEEWEIQVPSGMNLDQGSRQLLNVTPVDKDFFGIINTLRELSEIVGCIPPETGVRTDPNEKLGKTEMRAQGISNRIAGIQVLQNVVALSQLGYVFWVLMLERLGIDEKYKIDNGKEFTLNDLNGYFEFDCPHLSGLADNQIKATKWKEHYALIANDPLFSYPKIRMNILKKIATLDGLDDYDEVVDKQTMEEAVKVLTQPKEEPIIPGAM